MKKLTLIFFVAVAMIGSALGQAPSSVAGFTYREDRAYLGLRGERLVSLDLRSDGTYLTRLNVGLAYIPSSALYGALVNGSYTYTKLTSNQGILTLTPNGGSTDTITLSFIDSSQGTESDPGQPGNFSLFPTGGSTSTRALVNISTLVSVKQGAPVTIGFVVDGLPPAPNQAILNYGAPLREFLIRAVGPTLSTLGVSNAAANPVYVVRHGLPANIQWPGEQPTGPQSPPQRVGIGWSATTAASTTIAAENARAGAFSLIDGSNDKADVMLLYPGAYTITVNPPDSTSEGYVLIEVYEVE